MSYFIIFRNLYIFFELRILGGLDFLGI